MNRIDCDEFRAFIDPYIDGEFDERERALFDAHCALCPDCQEFLDQKSWLINAVKPLLQQPSPMSPDARSRLNQRLKVAQRPEKARAVVQWIARPLPALTIAAVSLLLILPLTGFNRSVVAIDLVNQHRRDLPLEVPTAVDSEVESWLAGKLPFAAAPPKFRDQRVSLLGARLSQVQTREQALSVPAAQLIYRVGTHKMSVQVFDGRNVFEESGDDIQMIGNRAVKMFDMNGHTVALFKVGALTYAVTSDLPAEEVVNVIGTSL